MNLTEKLRSGHVRRWHIVAVAREQTIADHMHRVGVIAEEILQRLDLFDWNSNLTLNVMRLAAIHDRHEFRMGDLPTPGKDIIKAEYGCDNYGETVHSIEDAAAKVDPEYAELIGCCGPGGECPLAGHIVKFADTLEAMNYVGIFGVGSHAHSVWRGLREQCGLLRDAVLREANASFADGSCRWADLDKLIGTLQEGRQWL